MDTKGNTMQEVGFIVPDTLMYQKLLKREKAYYDPKKLHKRKKYKYNEKGYKS